MELLISILTSAFWVILAITILVFIHELGHFLTAKYFGMKVERFSVGFPPKLFGRYYGGTEYVVGATPLGGYVKISGMIDESLDTEHVDDEPEPHEFRAKPVWQRIVVITGGVIFNVILAALIFAGINYAEGETYYPTDNIESIYVSEGSLAHDMGLRTGDEILRVNGKPFERFNQILPPALVKADSITIEVERGGEPVTIDGPRDIITRLSRAQNQEQAYGISFRPPLIGQVAPDTPADSAGLQEGDRILTVNGDTVRFWLEMGDAIQRAEGQPVPIRWFRPDSLLQNPNATPARLVAQRADGAVFVDTLAAEMNDELGRYVIGVSANSPLVQQMLRTEFGVKTEQYGVGQSLAAGVSDTWENAVTIVVTLKRVVTGRDEFRESLGGPVMIAQVTKDAAAAGAIPFWRIVAVLSVTLAIMNILPVPALDGGQLMFLLYEGITRRRPSVRVRLVAQQIGMILLLGFMTFLIFNDILRL